MKKIVMAVAAIAACAAAQAQTETPFYAELGYTGITYEEPAGKAHPGMLRAIFGWEASPYVAIEAMGALSVQEDTVRVGGTDVDFKVEHSWGLFVKPKMKLGDAAEIFGRLGFTEHRLKASAGGSSITDTGNDVSYGLGLKYSFSKSMYGVVDYMRYYDKDSIKIDGFTLGLGYKF